MRKLVNGWVMFETAEHSKKVFYNPVGGKIKVGTKEEAEDIYAEKFKNPFFLKESPRNLYIFPTSDCNLRCIYCYASAGERKDYLCFESVKTAIDNLFEKQSKLKIGFHGGGEPLMNFPLVKRSVEYLKSITNDYQVSLMTNGAFDEKKISWCINNMTNITVSLDGYDHIQNNQRPLASGLGSYDLVVKTIKLLQKNGIRYGVRTTITNQSINKMLEIIKHFHDLGIVNIKFEPIYPTGRFFKNSLDMADLNLFAENFLKCMKYANDNGIKLTSTFSEIKNIRDTYCGACGSNVCITPTSLISSCVEVTSKDDPASKFFIYGRIENSKMIINKNKLKTLQNRVVDNMNECKNCGIKYVCGGGCLIKSFRSTGEIYAIEKERCKTKKRMVEEEVKQIAREAGCFNA